MHFGGTLWVKKVDVIRCRLSEISYFTQSIGNTRDVLGVLNCRHKYHTAGEPLSDTVLSKKIFSFPKKIYPRLPIFLGEFSERQDLNYTADQASDNLIHPFFFAFYYKNKRRLLDGMSIPHPHSL